jgi:hypothetical protein
MESKKPTLFQVLGETENASGKEGFSIFARQKSMPPKPRIFIGFLEPYPYQITKEIRGKRR